MSLFEKMFGTFSSKELKKIKPIAGKVLALEDEFAAKTDSELRAMTPALRARLDAGESLDDILPEAFATCREAAWRVLGMKHFPVQVVGGIVLHRACIAEMKTGEGKTLVATLPVYLNALTGKGVMRSIVEAERVGPEKLFDVLVIAPCTGATLARLASGLTDTAVTMAAKSHLRTGQKVGIEPPAVPGAVERLQHIPQGRQGGRLVPLCRGLLEPSGGGDAGNEGVTLHRLLNEGGQPGPVLQPLRLEGQLLKADQ